MTPNHFYHSVIFRLSIILITKESFCLAFRQQESTKLQSLEYLQRIVHLADLAKPSKIIGAVSVENSLSMICIVHIHKWKAFVCLLRRLLDAVVQGFNGLKSCCIVGAIRPLYD